LGCTFAAGAQEFGRFGYTQYPSVPGFEIDGKGFRARQSRADRLEFATALPEFRATEVSELAASYVLGGKNRTPSKLRVQLLSPGFELLFNNGFSLETSSLQGPFLTWGEASVAPPYPTPRVPWVVVSFKDAQPPILISFLGKSCSVRVSGRSGAWRIENAGAFQGWVRIALPAGIRPIATTDVSQLGMVASSVKSLQDFWIQVAPKLLRREVRPYADGLLATWTFDRPGAVIPPAAFLASLGGYQPVVASVSRRVDSPTEEGPLSFCVEPKLTIRFPARRFSVGRSLVTGKPMPNEPPKAAPFEIPGLVQLALTNLLSLSGDVQRGASEGLLGDYLLGAQVEVEPHTGQKLPFEASGKGIDLAAAHAMLAQSVQLSSGSNAAPHGILTSVLWRRDWLTWRIHAPSEVTARRASILLSLACAMSTDPEMRLNGALFQTGVAAERGLSVWKQENRFQTGRKNFIEPLLSLRNELYFAGLETASSDKFFWSLHSPVRILQAPPFFAKQEGPKVTLAWNHLRNPAEPFTFETPWPFGIEASTNVQSIQSSRLGSRSLIRYKPVLRGSCEAVIMLPLIAQPLPEAVPVPSFTDSPR